MYKSLTTDQLMRRCFKGRTQNANESVDSKLWSNKNKLKFCGLTSLQQGARTTVAEHNFSFEQANVVAVMRFSMPSEVQ